MKRVLAAAFFLMAAVLSRATTITKLAVTAQSGRSITIQWTTDVAADSQVFYGIGTPSLGTNLNPALVTAHTMVLNNLVPGSTYAYRSVSADSFGNLATSATQIFTICDPTSIAPGLTSVNGSVNNYYEYGKYTFNWVNTSTYSISPTVCGVPLTVTQTGYMDGGASFNSQIADSNQIIPSPSQWSLTATGIDGLIGSITVQQPVTPSSNGFSSPLKAAAVGQLIHVWYDPVTTTFYPPLTGGGGGGFGTLCSVGSTLNSCIAGSTAATIAPGVVGSFTQYNYSQAVVTCQIDPTSSPGAIALLVTTPGNGYTGNITLTPSALPSGASLGTVTGNVTAGRVTSATVSGANAGFFTQNGNLYPLNCPITFTVPLPPPAAPPVALAQLNQSVNAYGPDVSVDDFGAAGDGVTDDTIAVSNAGAYATGNGTHHGTIEFTGNKAYCLGCSSGANAQGIYNLGGDNGFAPSASTFRCTATSGVPNSPCSLVTAGTGLSVNSITSIPQTGSPSIFSCSQSTGVCTQTFVGTYLTSNAVYTSTICTTTPTFTPGAVVGTGLQGTVNTLTMTGEVGCPSTFTVLVGPNGAAYTPSAVASQTVATLTVSGGHGYPASWLVYAGNTCGGGAPNFLPVPCGPLAPMQFTEPYQAQVYNLESIVGNGASILGAYGGSSAVGATNYTPAWPYVATFGSAQPASHVTVRDLNISQLFFGFGNIGSYFIAENVTGGGGCLFQGTNAQYGSYTNIGFGLQTSLVSPFCMGGKYISRSATASPQTNLIVNSDDLLDNIQISHVVHYGYGSNNQVQWAQQYRAFQCFMGDYLFRPQDGGTFNAMNCPLAPAGYQSRMTDQDIAAYAAITPDMLWRGFGNSVNLYSRYGRPIAGLRITDVVQKMVVGYNTVIGPNEVDTQVLNTSNEEGFLCYNSVVYGSPGCPNFYEPDNTQTVAGHLVSNPTDVFSDTMPVAFAYQRIAKAGDLSLFNSGVQNNQSQQNVGAVGPGALPIAENHLVALSGQANLQYQADGTELPGDSPSYQFPARTYNPATNSMDSVRMDMLARNSLYAPGSPYTMELSAYFLNGQSRTYNTQLKVDGLSVNPAAMQGGNVSGYTVVNGGFGYPPNVPVPCSATASPLTLQPSGDPYNADCMGVTNNLGQVSQLAVSRAGAGYIAPPAVTIAGPWKIAQITGFSASTSTLTVLTTATPVVGDSISVVGLSTIFGQAIDTATAASPLVVATVGAGFFTAPYASAGIGATTDSGSANFPNHGGVQATATASINQIDSIGPITHFGSCGAYFTSGGTVPAFSNSVLAGVICKNAVANSATSKQDMPRVLEQYKTGVNLGMTVTAFVTASNTLTIKLTNPTATPIAYTAGTAADPWVIELLAGSSYAATGTTITGTVSIPTVTTTANPTGAVLASTTFTSCALAADGAQWDCTGAANWPTTLSSTSYKTVCTLGTPSVGYSTGSTAVIYVSTKTTSGFNYAVVADHAGALAATYLTDCIAVN